MHNSGLNGLVLVVQCFSTDEGGGGKIRRGGYLWETTYKIFIGFYNKGVLIL